VTDPHYEDDEPIDLEAQAILNAYYARMNVRPCYQRCEQDAMIVQSIIGLPMRLKAHRAARNVSQREVARKAGISFATVSRIEDGHDYTVASLIAVATYLDGYR